jgi:hypothetical protein
MIVTVLYKTNKYEQLFTMWFCLDRFHCILIYQDKRCGLIREGLLTLCCQSLLQSEEVSYPNTINIKQYLNTSNYLVNNRHIVIKSSQDFTPETENVKIYDINKKYDLMAAINSLNRLICYKEWRKYQMCRVTSSFNCLIK